MHIRSSRELLFAITAICVFVATASFNNPVRNMTPSIKDHVVIPASIQMLLYGGDKYLAADVEMIRAAALGAGVHETDLRYLARSMRVVSQLNPCHEDNYYLGNALLSWGGADVEGTNLLHRAMQCRYWDEYPAFFYAINEYFFNRDAEKAKQALDIAADRATHNAAAFRKLGIMIMAEQIGNEKLALDYLKRQRDSAHDHKLKQMLDKRVTRLQGLITLRNAKKQYEKKFGHQLNEPQELVSSGILKQIPVDPLRLGYVYKDGEFELRKLRIKGRERRP